MDSTTKIYVQSPHRQRSPRSSTRSFAPVFVVNGCGVWAAARGRSNLVRFDIRSLAVTGRRVRKSGKHSRKRTSASKSLADEFLRKDDLRNRSAFVRAAWELRSSLEISKIPLERSDFRVLQTKRRQGLRTTTLSRRLAGNGMRILRKLGRYLAFLLCSARYRRGRTSLGQAKRRLPARSLRPMYEACR